ncbi:hypothetical protein [Prauserella rugosa]|uniref:Uncharacterized protein n=1 Tax=Prauserella rugosa TaxID=43354 RepID=A0A660CJH5_9PSEU|nr:hypothetical protein [Prauserella rugosa]KMS82144.1 hypothetical protein ACZ91_60145 [Streptomyces regensis]TWH22584.1 hypothetical protein JD82_04470 [Prauserella rugosa]
MTGEAVRCHWCGDRGPTETVAVASGWMPETAADVSGAEGRGTRWVCPACVREHVRAIEGKLPAEYW